MKILFLLFHGFQAYNGISKKIRYQIDAMKSCGADVRTCYYEVQPDGHRQWLVDDEVIADLGTGIVAKLKKRIDFSSIVRYIEREGIDMLYLRSFHNANPFTINLVRKIHQLGVKIIFEIPTYPYDQEYATLKEKFQIAADRLFRKQFCKYVDRIVTFSNDDTIFGCPTIRISNGIDFNSIPPDCCGRNSLLAWFRPFDSWVREILSNQSNDTSISTLGRRLLWNTRKRRNPHSD